MTPAGFRALGGMLFISRCARRGAPSCCAKLLARACSSYAVTRRNFPEALERFKLQLKASDYVSIDLEMSGMHSAPWRRLIEVDTVETRYQNIRDSSERFSIFQCGVCLFRYDASASKFVAHPFNFYLFPRNNLPGFEQRDHLCQTSSLEFLAKHNFDFNTCIYEGISYLSKEQEAQAREALEKVSAAGDKDRMSTKRKTSKAIFCERARLQVGLWRTCKIMEKSKQHMQQLQKNRTTLVNLDKDDVESAFPLLLVNVSDQNQAHLVVQVVKKHFADDLVPIFEYSNKQVKIIFCGKEHKASLQAKLAQAELSQRDSLLTDCVGFRRVIDAISESRKPLVGHNCLLDLAHIHSKFIGTLPTSFATFCSTVHEHFPCVLDTKYILKAEKHVRRLGIPSTTLSSAYAFFHGPAKACNTVEVADENERYTHTNLKHDAGYDAFMTGAVFAQLWRLACSDESQSSFNERVKRQDFSCRVHANLLYMGWTGHYVLDLSTGNEACGSKALPERLNRTAYDAVLVVWSPTTAPLGDPQHLKKLVSSCLQGTDLPAEVEVLPVDDMSAFLVFSSLSSKNRLHSAVTKSGHLQVAHFEEYEKLCKSSISVARLSDAIGVLRAEDNTNVNLIDGAEEVFL